MKDLIKEGYKIPREWREEYETCEISDEVRAEIMRDKWRTQNFAFNHNRCNFPGELWRHCNGDMHAALEYATRVKHEQKDFLTKQGIHALYD